MSARSDIEYRLVECGWAILSNDGHRLVAFQWLTRDVRDEITVCFDKAGRVEAWTRWHNRRVMSPDQDTGRRERLVAAIENPRLRYESGQR